MRGGAGRGHGDFAGGAGAAEVAAQRLAAVPFADGGLTEPLAVIHRQKKRLTPAMKKFIAFLKQPEPGEIPSPVGTGEGARRAVDGRAAETNCRGEDVRRTGEG